jgi:hypothetical protein
MTSLAVSHAARATGVSRIIITRAIKARWHSASRQDDESYEIGFGEARAIPSAVARAEAELRHRVALAEEQIGRPQ